MPIILDRMAIEEAGANPQLMAEAIHGQLCNLSGAVPVCAITLALDIDEIRERDGRTRAASSP